MTAPYTYADRIRDNLCFEYDAVARARGVPPERLRAIVDDIDLHALRRAHPDDLHAVLQHIKAAIVAGIEQAKEGAHA